MPELIATEIDPQTLELAEEVAHNLGISPSEVIRSATRDYVLEPLTKKQCALIAKVSLRTINNWLRDGLGHAKIGSIVRVSRTDLYAWMSRHKSLSPLIPEPAGASRGRKKGAKSKR